MAASKLDIINSELLLTKNEPVAVEDDGSDEWLVASAAYDSALEHLLDEHDWKFATQIEAINRIGDASDSDTYADEYARPQNALHIVWLKIAGAYESDFRVVGNRVQINAPAGTTVLAKYVLQPEPDAWNGLFGKAIRCLVRAGIYSGLNEDPGESRNCKQEAEIYLGRARARSDEEEPARARFTSRLLAARRVRRG